jgi:galactoside O-acetyltransferase
MHIISRIKRKLHIFFLRIKCKYIGKLSFIDKNVNITNCKGVIIGNRSNIYSTNCILNDNGFLVIGNNSHIAPGGYVNCIESKVNIGNNVAIGPKTCIIAYSNYYKLCDEYIDIHQHIKGDIFIGDNVFIGSNVSILPGIKITNNCVVGAGSVVNKDLLIAGVYVGAPARIIKEFKFK